MWESDLDVNEYVALVPEALNAGSKQSSAHLRRAVQAGMKAQLPLCLMASWGSKAKRILPTALNPHNQPDIIRDECSRCGLLFKHQPNFIVEAKIVKGSRFLVATCKGCGFKHSGGELPSLEAVCDSSLNQSSFSSLNSSVASSRSGTPLAMSTPVLNKSGKGPSTPITNPRIAQIQGRRPKKRRGSALDKLLKEEESESDRSLGGFLNLFSL